MTVELTRYEAEILIAVLTFAEGAALMENPAMMEALSVLRPWRSALLAAYLRQVGGDDQAAPEHSGQRTGAQRHERPDIDRG